MSWTAPFRMIMVATWVWAVAGLAAPDAVIFGSKAPLVAGALLGAHLLELPFYLKTYRRVGGSMGKHVAMTMVYGFFYFADARKA